MANDYFLGLLTLGGLYAAVIAATLSLQAL